MAINSVVLNSKTPATFVDNTFLCLWTYAVSVGDSPAKGVLRLGLSADISVADPSAYPQYPQLSNHTLVSANGSSIQYIEVTIADGDVGPYQVTLLAPCAEDQFVPVLLQLGPGAAGPFQTLSFATSSGGVQNVTQVLTGPARNVAGAPATGSSVAPKNVLPYASEPFGVYQPLIGWKSALGQDRLATAVTNRVMNASRAVSRMAVMTDSKPIGTVTQSTVVDRTGTMVGRNLAKFASDNASPVSTLTGLDASTHLADITRSVLSGVRHNAAAEPSLTAVRAAQSTHSNPANAGNASSTLEQEASMATVLHYLGEKSPEVLQQMFRPGLSPFDRLIAGAQLFVDNNPARFAFLSPIGILNLFQEYFFELGTFLGPPVGHVWISPGGTVELVEVNTNRVLTEQTMEQSTETVSKTELDQTDKDELSDAIKTENANDMKLGVGATASGGVAGIFQASGSASFNLDVSRKQAEEQTHKKMREQSAKLSSEVRQNFKTTFRTVTETTDTSSRRYVLQNTSDRLVSYELSRKMRKVAVQVQDLGQRLCWQIYVDNPGDPLGLGEFVHATGEALDPGLKVPDQQPYPANQQQTFSSAIPFILYQGADDGAGDTYVTSSDNGDHGIFSPDVGKDDIIQFTFPIKCSPTPPGFQLSQVTAIDFHGAQVKWDPNLNVDATSQQFTIHLTYANFGGKQSLPFDATLVYEPTADAKKAVDQANAAAKVAYDEQLAQAKEKQFYDTLRTRLKLVSQVKPRPQDDLRAEERSIIYRSVISRLYGSEAGWSNDDYHIASEIIRYFFDVDAMLYFVAPDWWRPRHQQLASMNAAGELQPTVIAEPALSARVSAIGTHVYVQPGHRPYYLITEETSPAPQGSSLGWLIQLDGDTHRNAFLNSPWVKAVLPIRPGLERQALAFLQRPEIAGTEGLDEPYPYDATQDPPEYSGLSIKDVLLRIADTIAQQYKQSLTPVHVDPTDLNSTLALPSEVVFAQGFDPLEGGIAFGAAGTAPFQVFSQWIEVLPTDQVVATEYSLQGL